MENKGGLPGPAARRLPFLRSQAGNWGWQILNGANAEGKQGSRSSDGHLPLERNKSQGKETRFELGGEISGTLPRTHWRKLARIKSNAQHQEQTNQRLHLVTTPSGAIGGGVWTYYPASLSEYQPTPATSPQLPRWAFAPACYGELLPRNSAARFQRHAARETR